MATDSGNRQLSVPADYPIEVSLLDTHDRVWMHLRDIVLTRSLPVRVRVMNMSADAHPTLANMVGEDMTLTEVKDTVFLRANAINNGWVDQVNMSLVPSFLGCEFVAATGMRGASPEEWTDYQGMYSRSVRHLNFTLMNGYSEIYVNCASPYPLLLDTIKKGPGSTMQRSPDFSLRATSPSTLSSPFSSPPVSPKPRPETPTAVYENLPTEERTAKPAARTKTSTNVYDNRSYVDDDAEVEAHNRPVSPTHVLPHFANAKDNYYAQNKIVVEPDLHPPPPISRAETPFSDMDENDMEEMFDNVIRVGQETLERQQMEERERREEREWRDKDERERVAQRAVEERERKEMERKAKLVRDKENTKNNKSSKPTPKKSSLKIQIKNSPQKTHMRSPDEAYTSHIETSLVRRSRMSSSDSSNNFKGSEPDLKLSVASPSGASVQRSSSSRTPSRSNSRHRNPTPPRGSYISETSSGTPMGVIQPLTLQRAAHSNMAFIKDNNLTISSVSSSGICSMEDVPADVGSLTVEDVCMCLQLLNMDIHISEFRGHQIDGKLLQDLRENVLLNEFHFTPFNASKLMRFVRGWRPNLA